MIMLTALILGLAAAPRDSTVQVEMHNVRYHFTDEIAVHIQDLRGELIPTKNNPLPVFDDKNSFCAQHCGCPDSNQRTRNVQYA